MSGHDKIRYYVLIGNDEQSKRIISDLFINDKFEDYQEFNNGNSYMLIKKEDISPFIKSHQEYQEFYDKLNDGKHECYNCGCISNVFYQDYRGQECTSKVYNCEFCHSLSNEHYNKLGETHDIKNYI